MYANKIVGVVFIVLGVLTTYYYGSMYYDLKFAKGIMSDRIEYQVLFLVVSGFILIFLGSTLILKKNKKKINQPDLLDDELDDDF